MMEFFVLMEQNIIMRFDGILANNISVPKNARLEKWLPQNDLLEHKNTVLFVTHAGNNGQFQAHGIPMLSIPVFGNQL